MGASRGARGAAGQRRLPPAPRDPPAPCRRPGKGHCPAHPGALLPRMGVPGIPRDARPARRGAGGWGLYWDGLYWDGLYWEELGRRWVRNARGSQTGSLHLPQRRGNPAGKQTPGIQTAPCVPQSSPTGDQLGRPARTAAPGGSPAPRRVPHLVLQLPVGPKKLLEVAGLWEEGEEWDWEGRSKLG